MLNGIMMRKTGVDRGLYRDGFEGDATRKFDTTESSWNSTKERESRILIDVD